MTNSVSIHRTTWKIPSKYPFLLDCLNYLAFPVSPATKLEQVNLKDKDA